MLEIIWEALQLATLVATLVGLIWYRSKFNHIYGVLKNHKDAFEEDGKAIQNCWNHADEAHSRLDDLVLQPK